MANRLELQKILEAVPNVVKVYFQPPEDLKISYPCIIYEEARGDTKRANNAMYLYRKAYSLLVIDEDPDSTIPDAIRVLPLCDTGQPYKVDNLNHWAFTIYY